MIYVALYVLHKMFLFSVFYLKLPTRDDFVRVCVERGCVGVHLYLSHTWHECRLSVRLYIHFEKCFRFSVIFFTNKPHPLVTPTRI